MSRASVARDNVVKIKYQIYSIQKIGHIKNDKNKGLSEDLFYNVWLKFIKSAGGDANLYEK